MANLNAQTKPDLETEAKFSADCCRLAYSSVLAAYESKAEAQKLLASIFTTALQRNPELGIGGILFYDEATNAVVQVLEGPALATRSLFQSIERDPRHTSVNVLWDIDVQSRRFAGFGMQLGNKLAETLGDGAEAGDQQGLLRLTYTSKLTAVDVRAVYRDIQSILACAVVTNPKLHIGGALFLNIETLRVKQVLEGPSRNVRFLYEKITGDPRHRECTVEKEETVEERDYDQWGMAIDYDPASVGGTESPASERSDSPTLPPKPTLSLMDQLAALSKTAEKAKTEIDAAASAIEKRTSKARRKSRDLEHDMWGMEIKDLGQLRAVFAEFDTSGDGLIDFDELCAALKKGGKNLSREECTTIMKQIDENNDGQISFEEFRKAFLHDPKDKK